MMEESNGFATGYAVGRDSTNGGGNNGNGMFGNDWAWIVILLLFGWGRNGFGGNGGGYAVAVILEGVHLGTSHAGDALFLERALHSGAHVVVLIGQNAWQGLHESYLGTEAVVHIGKFAADGTGTDDNHALRALGHN